MQRPILILLVAVTVLQASCDKDDNGVSSRSIPTGALRYVGYIHDTACVVGWLRFTKTTPRTDIGGEWHFEPTGETGCIVGPQVGDGSFEAGWVDEGLWLNLNPGAADNNVVLIGKFEGAEFQSSMYGTWRYSGFAGTISEGTFRAEK